MSHFKNSNDFSTTPKAELKPKANIWRRNEGPSQKEEVSCFVSSACGLCPHINKEYQKSFDAKIESVDSTLKKIQEAEGCKIIVSKPASTYLGYRTHTKYQLKFLDDPSRIKWEFVSGDGSKPDTRSCPLHYPRIKDLINDLDRVLVSSYFFENAKESIVAVSLRMSHLTDETMLTFFVRGEINRLFIKKIVETLKDSGHRIVSTYAGKVGENSGNLFSEENFLISGVQRLRVSLCHLSFETTPASNFPVNPWMSEKIFRRIEQLAGEQTKENQRQVAWSLYSSVGIGALILGRCGYQVFGVDQNSQAIRDAQANTLKNDLQDRLYFVPSAVEDIKGQVPDWAWHPSLIYAKLPRSGMSPFASRFVGEVMAANPNLVILIHAKNLEGLSKNLETLKEFGGQVRQIEVFDVFPYAKNLEYLCVVNFSGHRSEASQVQK